jgi:hypothetical protein
MGTLGRLSRSWHLLGAYCLLTAFTATTYADPAPTTKKVATTKPEAKILRPDLICKLRATVQRVTLASGYALASSQWIPLVPGQVIRKHYCYPNGPCQDITKIEVSVEVDNAGDGRNSKPVSITTMVGGNVIATDQIPVVRPGIVGEVKFSNETSIDVVPFGDVSIQVSVSPDELEQNTQNNSCSLPFGLLEK